jgi:hypothetical protein
MYVIILTFFSFLLSSKPFCQTLASMVPPYKQVPPCKACPYKQKLDFDYLFSYMHFSYTLIIFSSIHPNFPLFLSLLVLGTFLMNMKTPYSICNFSWLCH